MEIKVYKFGGASIKDAESIRNVAKILKAHNAHKIVVIMSALGKTTNKLEAVLNKYFEGAPDEALQLLTEIKQQHFTLLEELVTDPSKKTLIANSLNDQFVEIEWIIEDEPDSNYDYLYDQMIAVGELLSTKLVGAYLQTLDHQLHWLDVRDVLLTDNRYREAKIEWEETEKRINKRIPELFIEHQLILTQGFIGSSSENFTTTLGREGSDFTASIFSYCLNVDSVTIWKDVDGILTGDPRKNEKVALIENLSFREAIEMTYYGAKVIHPRTIKPLQNKSIPLFVKSFLNPEAKGTKISAIGNDSYPPITVIEDNQVLLKVITRDFSFIAEDHLSIIFNLINKYNIKIRLMRNSAVSFVLCILHPGKKLQKFLKELSALFELTVEEDLVLLTIRHFDEATLSEKTMGKKIVFQEKYDNTIQLLMR